jgi:hypothetical protein
MQVPMNKNKGKSCMAYPRNAQKIICCVAWIERPKNQTKRARQGTNHQGSMLGPTCQLSRGRWSREGSNWGRPSPRFGRTWTPSRHPDLWREDHPYLLQGGGWCFLTDRLREPTSQAIKGGLPPPTLLIWRQHILEKKSRGTPPPFLKLG